MTPLPVRIEELTIIRHTLAHTQSQLCTLSVYRDVHILALDVQWNLLMDNSHGIKQLLYLRNVLSVIFSAVSSIS